MSGVIAAEGVSFDGGFIVLSDYAHFDASFILPIWWIGHTDKSY